MAQAVNNTRRYDFAAGKLAAYTGTAGAVTAFGNDVDEVLISVSTLAYVCVGATATVGAGSFVLNPGVPLAVQIVPGQTISAIQSAAGGNLCVIPAK